MIFLEKILNKQFELYDSLDSYNEVSFTRKEIMEDENGKYQIKVSYSEYKYGTEYPDNGIIGYREEKIYKNNN